MMTSEPESSLDEQLAPESGVALGPEQAEELDQQGWTVIDVLGPDECDLLVRYLAGLPQRVRDLGEGNPLRIHSMVSMDSPLLSDYLADERLVGPMMKLLGPDIRVFWEQVITRTPTTTGTLPWHQDAGYSSTFGNDMFGVWLALTDAQSSNGGLHMIPGSHKGGLLRHARVRPGIRSVHPDDMPPQEEAVSLTLTKGQAVVFTAYTIHASFGNHSDRSRVGWIAHYAAAGATHGATGRPLGNRPWVARDGEMLGKYVFDEEWNWSQPVSDGWVDLAEDGTVLPKSGAPA